MRKLTTIRLDDADRHAIATIRLRYGVASDSDAIRLALRLVAESQRVDIRLHTPHSSDLPDTADALNAEHNG